MYQEVGLLDSLLLPLQGICCLTQHTAFSSYSGLTQLLLSHSDGTPKSCIFLYDHTVKLDWHAQSGMPQPSGHFGRQVMCVHILCSDAVEQWCCSCNRTAAHDMLYLDKGFKGFKTRAPSEGAITSSWCARSAARCV